MKLHLPKAVICSVLMSAMVSTVWADAVIVTPNTIVGKDVDGNSVDVTIDGDSEIPTAWKDYHEATGTYGVYAQAYLKDGVNSTLTIKNLGTADTAVEVNSPLYIREGSAKISDSNIVTKTWSPVNQAMIQVAGNNAGLTLTNTSYIYKSWSRLFTLAVRMAVAP